jgi:ribosomal-protein-alanine N-acetyltransferase
MLTTDRLILRRWQARDAAAFAALNADPEVMDPPLPRAESDALIHHFEALFQSDGFAFAAAELKQNGAFAGMIGLQRFDLDPVPGPCVEIGWRLPRALWGKGYATEAARAWLGHGFATLGLAEIVAFTEPANTRSLAVMRRLGMRRDPARDFSHPEFPAEDPKLLFFALAREAWSDAAP